MNKSGRRSSRGTKNFTCEQFANDLRVPMRFLTDCGIRTETVDGEAMTAIPYRNTAGDVVCTEHRSSLHVGLIDDWEDGPYLYGLGLYRLARTTGSITLVERVEDVLVAYLNGTAAVAFRSISWWPRHWTPLLSSIPRLYAFLDLEKNASFTRQLALSELGNRTFVRDCRDDEQLLELHLREPSSLHGRCEKYRYEASFLPSYPYWRHSGEWHQP